VTIRYTSLRFVGSALLGTCFALVVTSLVYVATNRKPEILVLFFPLAILFTWAAVSLWERARKEDADFVRKRYRAGKIPIEK
jgi:hypothetical protein